MEEYLMQFFEYAHLPPHLQSVSKPFGDLAQALKRFGAECDYVDALLAKPQPEAPKAGG